MSDRTATPSEDPAIPRPRFGNLVRSLTVSIGLAYVVTVTLLHRGVPLPYALAASAICPVADSVYEAVKRKQLSAVAVLSLIGIVAGVGLSLWRAEPRFALAKESVVSGVIGCVFLASLVRGKPAIFRFSLEMTDQPHLYESLWASQPLFRTTMRRMTVLWGTGLVLESATRIAAALTLPPETTVSLSPLIAAVTFGVLIVWTALWSRRATAAVRAAGAPETGR